MDMDMDTKEIIENKSSEGKLVFVECQRKQKARFLALARKLILLDSKNFLQMPVFTKPIYLMYPDHVGIQYETKVFLVDKEDYQKIISFTKKFCLLEEDAYPLYHINNKSVNLLEFLYIYKKESVNYHFLNNNKEDLRRQNVNVVHHLHSEVMEKYNVISYLKGHYSNNGKEAYIMKNPIWIIQDMENNDMENNDMENDDMENDDMENSGNECPLPNHSNECPLPNHSNECPLPNHSNECPLPKECYLMYCEGSENWIKLCPKGYELILNFEKEKNKNKKLTWTTNSLNAYPFTHVILNEKNTCLYMHQIIMNYYGHGKGTKDKSVDHKNRIRTDNRLENVHLVDQKAQIQNTKGVLPGTKKQRAPNENFPDCIQVDMMRKYVYYHWEYTGKNKIFRDYFALYDPKLGKTKTGRQKRWYTTKSMQINLVKKLEIANQAAKELEEDDIMPPSNTKRGKLQKEKEEEEGEEEEEEKEISEEELMEELRQQEEKQRQREEERKVKQLQVNKQRSENMKGEKNHNYGKEKTAEIKKNMSLSSRKYTDEQILLVRGLLEQKKQNIEIEKETGIPAFYISRIKNGQVKCTTELTEDTPSNIKKSGTTQMEQNINRRKASLQELISVLDILLVNKVSGRANILKQLHNSKNLNENIVGNIIKNIKTTKKLPIYEQEVSAEVWEKYQSLIT